MSMSRRVFIVGAGFSKAINSAMPTMVELRDHVLMRLRDGGHAVDLDPFSEDIEQWLSYLAVGQPWLSDEDNLRNQALFVEVAQLIYNEIENRELNSRSAAPPDWLTPLVEKWAEDEAAIITFNYDLLMERVICDANIVRTLSDLYAIPLSFRWPAGSSGFFSVGQPPGPTPRVMKLHGSLNWRYGGLTAPVTEELYITNLSESWSPSGDRQSYNLLRNETRFEHKVPLIVPPTGVKNQWYSNLALRSQWQRAAKEIANGTELIVMGYSFPVTDLLVRHLVACHWTTGRPVVVVDQSTQPADSLCQLLRQNVDGSRFTGREPVAAFVNYYVAQ